MPPVGAPSSAMFCEGRRHVGPRAQQDVAPPRLLEAEQRVLEALGEVPAAEVHRGGPEVVNLDPVGRIPVAVVESRVIAGHELRDDQRGWQFDDLEVEEEDRIRFAGKAGRDGVIGRRSDGTRRAGDDPGERIKQQAGRQGRGNRIAVRRSTKHLGRVRGNRHSRDVTRGTGRVAGQDRVRENREVEGCLLIGSGGKRCGDGI